MESIENQVLDEQDILNTINKNDVDWTTEHEQILIEWADKAMCYRWLHSKSNALYSSLNAWYTIPVIIISTLTGTANFAQNRVPEDYQNFFAMAVGGFNILGGIISTIQQFLKITQLNESHRVSGIAWDKFYRNVKIEVAKHPSERMPPGQMLKMSKEEFDRLMETSPTIPEKIVNVFKTSFKHSDAFDKIVKPEICDVLVSTDNYRNPWYNDENMEKNEIENIKNKNAKEKRQKLIHNTNINLVKEFKKTFFNLNNRNPMDSEITDNLKEKIEMSVLVKIIEDLKNVDFSNAEITEV
jgi:hypothetical protein